MKRSSSILTRVVIPGLFVLAGGTFVFQEHIQAQSAKQRKFLKYGILDYSKGGKRLWSNPKEKLGFMVKMVNHLITPVPDRCIDELHRRLKRGKPGAFMNTAPPGNSSSPSACQAPGGGGSGIDGEGSCHEALKSCGNCHVPAKNNCAYDITYDSGRGKPEVLRFATIVSTDVNSLVVNVEGRGNLTLAHNKIFKSVWLNGEDPLWVWWDFKKFSNRGKMAAKMLNLSQKHQVACTNCHLRHGDFRLTPEGVEFAKSGKVIKKVPLSAMH